MVVATSDRTDVAAGFPPDVPAIDAEDYFNPAAMPPGKVLVVGAARPAARSARS